MSLFHRSLRSPFRWERAFTRLFALAIVLWLGISLIFSLHSICFFNSFHCSLRREGDEGAARREEALPPRQGRRRQVRRPTTAQRGLPSPLILHRLQYLPLRPSRLPLAISSFSTGSSFSTVRVERNFFEISWLGIESQKIKA